MGGLACVVWGIGVHGVQADQTSAEHIERGRVDERAQAFDDAMHEYEAALTVDPNSTVAMFNLARMYSLKHQWQNAAEWYNRALALDPNNAEAHYHLAMVYSALRDFVVAVTHYDRAKVLGYTQDLAKLEGVLHAYRNREMTLEVDSLSGQRITVRIIGTPLGDDALKRDILGNVQILEHGFDPATLRGVRVEFVGWQGEKTWLERWSIQTATSEHAYVVTCTEASGGGIDFNITEAPPAQPSQQPEKTETKRQEL